MGGNKERKHGSLGGGVAYIYIYIYRDMQIHRGRGQDWGGGGRRVEGRGLAVWPVRGETGVRRDPRCFGRSLGEFVSIERNS